MALEVEDGTGKADAESYISVADADSHHYLRGHDDWDALEEVDKERALRKATDFMVEAYRLRWAGVRVSGVQALDWPRNFVPRLDFRYASQNGYTLIGGNYYYPSDEVPAEVKRACAELALKSLAGPLSPDLDPPVTRETVGPITTEYAVGARQTVQYRAIDQLLAPFLKGNGSTIPVVRA